MDMVRHEHVRMDGTVFSRGQLTQSLQVTEVVQFTKEAWLAIVAPLDHVLGDTGSTPRSGFRGLSDSEVSKRL